MTHRYGPENFMQKFHDLGSPQATYIFSWGPYGGQKIYVSKVCHVGYQTRCESPTKAYLKTECENNAPGLRKHQNRVFFEAN